MRIVTANEFQSWLEHGQVLEKDSHGVKVMHLNDGHYLKIFRSRRHPWLVRWFPDAQRFKRHAQRLNQLGIHTPQIIESLWIDPRRGISACLYSPLAGRTLEQLYRQTPSLLVELLPELASYIKSLHRKGIYFRSLHLGNILIEGHQFGLIDFLDLRFKRAPLSQRLIHRNFAHLQNYLQRRQLDQFPIQQLIQLYNDDPEHPERT